MLMLDVNHAAASDKVPVVNPGSVLFPSSQLHVPYGKGLCICHLPPAACGSCLTVYRRLRYSPITQLC